MVIYQFSKHPNYFEHVLSKPCLAVDKEKSCSNLSEEVKYNDK